MMEYFRGECLNEPLILIASVFLGLHIDAIHVANVQLIEPEVFVVLDW